MSKLNSLFHRFALVFCLLSLLTACQGGDDDSGEITRELFGLTADGLLLQFSCTVNFTADIEASEEGKQTSVGAFLTEAVLPVMSMLQSADVLQDPAVLAQALDEYMTERTEGAASTMGLFMFSTACTDVRERR